MGFASPLAELMLWELEPTLVVNHTGEYLPLAIGHHGVRRLHRYCEDKTVTAKSKKMKSLQALAGGISGAENAARLIRHGRRLKPNEVGLYLVLDKKPRPTLLALTRALRQHGLKIDILVAKSTGVSVCRRL